VDYFRGHPEAARAAGFPPGRVISVGQYWERRRALGILPFWFLFVGMVWQVTRMGIIQGRDMILDATTQKAWFHEDSQAGWSFPKPWKGSVWGYKVHTLLCRWSALPVMFLVTPANAQESVLAIPLLVLAVAFFGFPIVVVRADAKAEEFVDFLRARREHDDRGLRPLPDAPADLEPVDAGQHDVENHEVRLEPVELLQRAVPVVRGPREVSVAAQVSLDDLRHHAFVLDNEDAVG